MWCFTLFIDYIWYVEDERRINIFVNIFISADTVKYDVTNGVNVDIHLLKLMKIICSMAIDFHVYFVVI